MKILMSYGIFEVSLWIFMKIAPLGAEIEPKMLYGLCVKCLYILTAYGQTPPTKVSLLWSSGGACVVIWTREVCYCWGLPCQTGQKWWPRWKGIPWSSRLGVGHEANNLTS
jgi:hypothetical protein